MRRPVVFTLVAALVVFCIIQDRLTAAGARSYVERQRAALAAGGPTTTIEAVMRPAIGHAVRQASFWSGLVMAAGLAAAVVTRRTSRE